MSCLDNDNDRQRSVSSTTIQASSTTIQAASNIRLDMSRSVTCLKLTFQTFPKSRYHSTERLWHPLLCHTSPINNIAESTLLPSLCSGCACADGCTNSAAWSANPLSRGAYSCESCRLPPSLHHLVSSSSLLSSSSCSSPSSSYSSAYLSPSIHPIHTISF